MICEGITSIQVTDANKILEIFAATFREPWLKGGEMMPWVFQKDDDDDEWNLFSQKRVVFYKKGMNLKDF